MPLYFFHLRDDLIVDDEEGRDLPDLAAAHAVAVREARAQMCETMLQGRISLQHYIEVADADGRIADRVTFGEAVRVES